MLHRSFKPAKCKTALQMASSRLKILKNKKDIQIKQLKRELAQLLEAGQDQTARIRVEHVVREEKMVAAYELVGIYCELLVARLAVIESQKMCPTDLKEAVASVVFASRRMADATELVDVHKHFTAKYGKEFVSAAVELRPNCGVSRLLAEKLSVKAPDGPTKIKILSAIAEEHNVQWEPKSFGEPDPKSPEELLSGPNTFETATKMHVDPHQAQDKEPSNVQAPPVADVPHRSTETYDVPVNTYAYNGGSPSHSQDVSDINFNEKTMQPDSYIPNARQSGGGTKEMEYRHSYSSEGNASRSNRHKWDMEFKDATAAARAAAESAERASMAARAAAELSCKERIMSQNSAESQNSSSYGFRDESLHRYDSYKLQSESIAEDRHCGKNSRMQYQDMDGMSKQDKLAEEFHKHEINKNDDLSADYLKTSGRYSRKNSSEMRQSNSFGKSAVAELSSKGRIMSQNSAESQNLSSYGFRNESLHRYDSSKLQSENFAEEHHSGKNSRIQYEDMDGMGCKQDKLAEEFQKYEINKNDDVSVDYLQTSGRYSRKNSSEMRQSISCGKSGARKQSIESDVNIFGPLEEVQVRKQSSRASSHSHSNTFGEEHDLFAADDNKRVQSSTTEMNSHDDDYSSFFDKPKFDEEDVHDEQEYGLGFSLLGQKSPAHRLKNANSWSFTENQEEFLTKKSSQSQTFTEKQSSPISDDISARSAAPFHVDGSLSAKYDDDSSPDSEIEEESRKAEASSSKHTAFESPRRYTKSQMFVNDINRDSFTKPQSQSSPRFPVEDSRNWEDSKTLEESSVESQMGLKFGTLTGGLRNKGKRLPPYTPSPLRDAPSEQEDEYASTMVEQSFSSSSRVRSSGSSISTSKNPYNEKLIEEKIEKAHSRAPDPSSSDDDSEHEILRRTSGRSQGSNFKAPVSSYFRSPCSEDDEEVPRKTPNVNTRPKIGYSRRTKAQAKTPERSSFSKISVFSEPPGKAKKDESEKIKLKSQFYDQDECEKSKPKSQFYDQASFRPSPELKSHAKGEKPKLLEKDKTTSPLTKIATSRGAETAGAPSIASPSKEKPGHVHPKLPDYDDLLATFESLRSNCR